jgi:MFS family permease
MADSAPSQQPIYQNLLNRTFIGFLIAAFLAAFNDQCIHASAMFFAIRTETLTPGAAISLMPILFFLPWAIFCTLAAYLSDRYSKRRMMIVWKFTEILIALIALIGFWFGEHRPFAGAEHFGAWAVLACVFLMGSHSAFYVPNKYGVLPEIFPTHLLSRANGFVEMASFLAVIIGTTTGGFLSDERFFKFHETYIGLFLLATSTVGFLSALMIAPMKPANPDRPFPGWNPLRLYKPLVRDLKMLLSLRSRRTAMCSIAFFTFMTAYMRGVMYMHGESQNPIWSELKTSMVVGIVALGVGIGSPLAGFLSGGKLELGMVTFGTLGMAIFSAVAAFAVLLHNFGGDVSLNISLVAIGFFSGFYVLPMYTMLQFRAPKGGKGATIAASNFLNVTGAILASLLFWGLQAGMHAAGLAPSAHPTDVINVHGPVQGTLSRVELPGSIEIDGFEISRTQGDHPQVIFSVASDKDPRPDRLPDDYTPGHQEGEPVKYIVNRGKGVGVGDEVIVSTYRIRSKSTGRQTTYFHLRRAGEPLPKIYDNQDIPAYLFLGGTLLSLVVLVLLVWQLPDLFARFRIWWHALGRYTTTIVNSKFLPDTGPVLLVTDGQSQRDVGDIHACCDRQVYELEGQTTTLEDDVKLAQYAFKHDDLLLAKTSAPMLPALLERLAEVRPELIVLPVKHSINGGKKVKVTFHEGLPTSATLADILTSLARPADSFATDH